MTSDNTDSEPTGDSQANTREHDERKSHDSSIGRRGALGLLGLIGLGALMGQSTAQPPAKQWQRDQDADGNALFNLGVLTMAEDSEGIVEFAGEGLEITDNQLTIDLDVLPDGCQCNAGRYIELDEENNELIFTGAAEWGNDYTDASNDASGDAAVVAGGEYNEATAEHATVGGGEDNLAEAEAATLSGGAFNHASGDFSTLAGGQDNAANGVNSAVGGGFEVFADGKYAVGSGGLTNNATGDGSAVGGGFENGADGLGATVPGGSGNNADGDYSVAAGRNAYANHDGAFVVGNSTVDRVSSNNAEEVRFQAGGGFVVEDLNTGNEAPLTYDSGTGELLVDNSSAQYKTNIEPLNPSPEAVLDLIPRSFEYTDSGRDGVGLIAEEVAEHVPELVITDEDGRPDAVRYDRLGLYLIPELRRQRVENTMLRERLAALEEEVGIEPTATDGGGVDIDQ